MRFLLLLAALLSRLSGTAQVPAEISFADYNRDSVYTVRASVLQSFLDTSSGSTVFIIWNPLCPGLPRFIRKMQRLDSVAGANNMNYILWSNSAPDEIKYVRAALAKHRIRPTINLVIDTKTYRRGFGTKKGYSRFLDELCKHCNNGSLGYGFIMLYHPRSARPAVCTYDEAEVMAAIRSGG